MKVSKGLGTYAGLITAFAQYLAAIALFLEADDQALALGPLATATLTLITVIAGRMKQANTLAAKPATFTTPMTSSTAETLSANLGRPVAYTTSTGTAAITGTTWTSPRPGAEMSHVADIPEPGDPDALPEYETSEDVPPDTGDEHARPEAE